MSTKKVRPSPCWRYFFLSLSCYLQASVRQRSAPTLAKRKGKTSGGGGLTRGWAPSCSPSYSSLLPSEGFGWLRTPDDFLKTGRTPFWYFNRFIFAVLVSPLSVAKFTNEVDNHAYDHHNHADNIFFGIPKTSHKRHPNRFPAA